MVLSVGLSFGVVAAVGGCSLGRAAADRAPQALAVRNPGGPGGRSAVDYDEVFGLLARYIGREGRAAEQLAAMPRWLVNHALDAVGVGAFAALRPDEATRIGGVA